MKVSPSRKVPITLTDEALKAFETLKSLLTTAEILSFPHFEKPFNFATDASNTALGTVLPPISLARSTKLKRDLYRSPIKKMESTQRGV